MADVFEGMSVEEQAAKLTPKGKFDPKKREAVVDPQQLFLEHGGEVTMAVARFVKTFCEERNLTMEEATHGVCLLTCNMRADFPPELGGTEKFDLIAAAAQDYYAVASKES
jgi:hypothetical protein